MKRFLLAFAMLLSAYYFEGQTARTASSKQAIRKDGTPSFSAGTVTEIQFVNAASAYITLSSSCDASSGICTITAGAPTFTETQFLAGPRRGSPPASLAGRAIFPDDLCSSVANDQFVTIQSGLFACVAPSALPTAARTQRTAFFISSPGAAENVGGVYFVASATITNGHCVVGGSSSPSVTPSFKYGTDRSAAGTAVMTTPAAITSTTTGTDLTLNATAIPTSGFLWLTTTAQSGTVTYLSCTITYTVP